VSSATQKTALEAAGGHPRLGIHAKLPLDEAAIAVAADVLEEVAEGAFALGTYDAAQRGRRKGYESMRHSMRVITLQA